MGGTLRYLPTHDVDHTELFIQYTKAVNHNAPIGNEHDVDDDRETVHA